MSNIDYSIDSNCVKNLPLDTYEKDFTFIVNGKRHQTSRVVADLLSPLIRKLHYVDPSINEFNLEYKITQKGQTNDQDYFDDFLSLSSFEVSEIDEDHQKHYQHYFYSLGNINEYFRLQPNYIETLSIENVLDRLQTLNETRIKFNETMNSSSTIFEKLIEYASEHFEEFDKEKMKNLPIEIIEEIIKNENLKLNEEDSLIEFILSLYKKDHSTSNLFEYVLFYNLSEEKMKTFLEEIEFEYINNQIFRSICKRFFKKENSNSLNEKRYINKNIKEFEPKQTENFEGIMHYLTQKTGGNIHDNGTIEITSNSIHNHPKNLVDYQSSNYYHSLDDGNAFVCFDFKDKLIQISSYSIQSRNNNENNIHLKNWVIEISENGQNWEEVDHHENDSILRGPNFKSRFNISKQQTKFYRFIRLRQTGNSWWYSNNHNYIGFTFFEIYGKLIEPKK